jgi:group I intron endonuclease
MNSFCVYSIKNTVTSRSYYGSSHCVNNRFVQHKWLLGKGTHHSKKLQNSWNKHGADNFIFAVLAVYENEDMMLEAEKAIIVKEYANSYNISTEVNKSHMLGRHHTEETKQKLRDIFTGRVVSKETVEKIKIARAKQVMPRGRICTEKTRQSIRRARAQQVMTKGRVTTEDAKHKMRLAKLGRKFPRVKIKTPDGVIIGYEAAAKQFSVSKQTIKNWIKYAKTGWSVQNINIRHTVNSAI